MPRHTKERLEPIVKKNLSWAAVCRELGIRPATGSQSHLKNVAIRFEIDFSHFTGQGWRKGMIFPPTRPIEDYLSGKVFIKSHSLKLRLFRDKLKETKCEECRISEWNNQEIPLELDHIDKNHNNNNISNLRILCPNCHAIKTRKDRKKKG